MVEDPEPSQVGLNPRVMTLLRELISSNIILSSCQKDEAGLQTTAVLARDYFANLAPITKCAEENTLSFVTLIRLSTSLPFSKNKHDLYLIPVIPNLPKLGILQRVPLNTKTNHCSVRPSIKKTTRILKALQDEHNYPPALPARCL